MSARRTAALIAASATVATLALVPPGTATADRGGHPGHGHGDRDVRFATYNASLNRSNAGDLLNDLRSGTNAQAGQVAEIIQRTRPDVLLINEFDFYEDGEAAELFRDNYLKVSQGDARPVDYPYYFVAPSNTGIPSGKDLDNSCDPDNSCPATGPGDAFGFGFFPGQFGMVVYSKYPIDQRRVRTFQNFLWKDMPGAMLPDYPQTSDPDDGWYSEDELDVFRLSSKSHWDIPIRIDRKKTVHFLVSHPTPPVFDGPEDRNGTRNFDEIRLWADYVSGKHRSSYIYDDEGRYGGLHPGASFVIAGDQNSDPLDGDSIAGSIQQLLDNPRINTSRTPSSRGAVEASRLQPGNESHRSPPRFDTADFGEPPGNLRADYVLPSRDLKIEDSAVFWPVLADPRSALITASDHRPVWVDIKLGRRH